MLGAMAANTGTKVVPPQQTSERGQQLSAIPQVETLFSNGDLSVTLTRYQWTRITEALAIASAFGAGETNYELMFEYAGLCTTLGQRLGLTQTAVSGDGSPPQTLARGASA